VALIAGAGVLVFGVPFRGPLLVFLAQTILFLVGALGLGMVISAAAKTQFLATQIALIATLLPAMLLSGFLFEIEAMPPALQAVTYAVPARYYVVVARGIMLKGVGPSVLWTQSVFMIAFAVAGIGLAARVFRKEVA
jgi:ABC-2 type transport system permease protein